MARASLCVAQNVSTYLSSLREKLLNSVRETVRNYPKATSRNLLVLFGTKHADFFRRQKRKSFNSFKKINVVKFERHRNKKPNTHTHATHTQKTPTHKEKPKKNK